MGWGKEEINDTFSKVLKERARKLAKKKMEKKGESSWKSDKTKRSRDVMESFRNRKK